jgi:hypothetical protein
VKHLTTLARHAQHGLILAALGRKEEAIREGRRASELLPVTKDAINGALIMQYLGVIYAWAGERDLAIEQIAATLQVPGSLSYGQLRLHPFWDPLRGDPRFEKLVEEGEETSRAEVGWLALRLHVWRRSQLFATLEPLLP